MRAVLSAESLPAESLPAESLPAESLSVESLSVEPLSAANRLKRQIESQTPNSAEYPDKICPAEQSTPEFREKTALAFSNMK